MRCVGRSRRKMTAPRRPKIGPAAFSVAVVEAAHELDRAEIEPARQPGEPGEADGRMLVRSTRQGGWRRSTVLIRVQSVALKGSRNMFAVRISKS